MNKNNHRRIGKNRASGRETRRRNDKRGIVGGVFSIFDRP